MSEGFVISATGKASIVKDPNAMLDYTEDWSQWLAPSGDQITTVQTFVASDKSPSTIVVTGAAIIAGTAVVAWISGGVVDERAVITYRITTLGGRTDDRSFTMKIKER